MIYFYDLHPPIANFYHEVISGLSSSPKEIPPKFFYDKKGSELFDKITTITEYYPTEAELEILTTYKNEMIDLLGKNCLLVEFGSGSSQKIRLLLDNLQPAAYAPMDISRQHLQEATNELKKDYPDLDIHAICADYSMDFDLPYSPDSIAHAGFFPGSSIGNFHPSQARTLLKNISHLLGQQARLLIGVDLKKSTEILNAAYNDARGITAAFNLNLLQRINREIDGNFIIENFSHHAFYNKSKGRIEMHLRSKKAQTVSIGTRQFSFTENETIHTENSYKYTIAEFQQLAETSGFRPIEVWTDDKDLFSVHCLETV